MQREKRVIEEPASTPIRRFQFFVTLAIHARVFERVG